MGIIRGKSRGTVRERGNAKRNQREFWGNFHRYFRGRDLRGVEYSRRECLEKVQGKRRGGAMSESLQDYM